LIENIAQLFAVFTPKRWELLAVLREHGPLSIFALARLLHRDYKNVQNPIYAPFADISVDMHLPHKQAASTGAGFDCPRQVAD